MNELKVLNELVQIIMQHPELMADSLKVIDEFFHGKDCPYLQHCVSQFAISNFFKVQPTEQDVYMWFVINYKTILGNDWNIIQRKNIKGHIPDFWLKSPTNEFMPVECKLDNFDKKALKQLERYMRVYKCTYGVAIADSLNVELPKNIAFIRCEKSKLISNRG